MRLTRIMHARPNGTRWIFAGAFLCATALAGAQTPCNVNAASPDDKTPPCRANSPNQNASGQAVTNLIGANADTLQPGQSGADVAAVLAGNRAPRLSRAQMPTSPPLTTAPEVLDLSALAEQGKPLVEQARAGSGSSGKVLATYNGHYTMLTARTKSGGAEVHEHFADWLFVIDGEGTELTGGTVIEGKEQGNGETRGARLDGATPHTLHKGDVIRIPAGTPHQAIETPGQTITIFVIKVQEPAS